MTGLRPQPGEAVLHLDVAKRWWLRHLPYSAEAERLLHETLASRAVYFIAVEGLLSDVLREFVHDLGDDLDPFLARQIAGDAIALFDQFRTEQLLRMLPREPLLRSALLACARYHLSFDDALAMRLAEESGSPLLIADPVLYEVLIPLERELPNFHLAWLGDVLGQ